MTEPESLPLEKIRHIDRIKSGDREVKFHSPAEIRRIISEQTGARDDLLFIDTTHGDNP